MTTHTTSIETHSEFEIDAFAEYYEALSDSFINMNDVTESIKAKITRESKLFEIGLGTGYFARHLYSDGLDICGIQPPDRMLVRLKKEHPNIKIKAEESLQDYVFDSKYDVIVSHSSVFLFTKLEMPFATGENQIVIVFQSFISDRNQVFGNIEKVMNALAPEGRFFMNIQANPKKRVEVNKQFTFEMLSCEYHFDSEIVRKVFCATYRGEEKLIRDNSFIMQFGEFKRIVEAKGYRIQISEDELWVIMSRRSEQQHF